MSEVTVCTAAVDDGAADDSGADDAGAADDDAAEDDYGGAAVLVSREQAAGNAMTVASRANLVNMMPPRPWATPERTVRQHVESCKDACPSAEALWHHLGQGEAGRPAISGASRYHVWVVNGSVMESPRCKTRRRRYPRVDTPARVFTATKDPLVASSQFLVAADCVEHPRRSRLDQQAKDGR